jgi:peptidoglycan/LPS O-acetylase OafA/YrhL
MKFGYQKEIDSLRVFAVIPVILFHLNYNFSPNGYLGVDLFFVISGFVITKTLLKYKEIHGEIEIISFFLRRLKRIYPALIVMIVISSIFVSYFGVINFFNFHLYLKTGLFSIFGVSNIFLIYKSDDYFLNQENNPFTHTWSLGVEEQFYFIYPFLLFLIFKINTNKSFNKLIYYILTIISAVYLYLFFF